MLNLKYELKKLIVNKLCMGVMISLFVVLIGMIYFFFMSSQMAGREISNVSQAIKYNQQTAKMNEGELTDKHVKHILNNYIELVRKEKRDELIKQGESPNMNVFGYYLTMEMTEPGSKDLWLGTAENPKFSADDLKIKPVSKLGIDEKLKPIKIASFGSWTYLYQITEAMFIPLMVVLMILLAGIFSSEKYQNIDQLLRSTRLGRTLVTKSKVISATLISLVSFTTVSAIIFIAFFGLYGLDGWDASVQSNFLLKLFAFPIHLSNLEFYLAMLLLQLFSTLLVTYFTLLISSYTNNPFVSLIISLGIFALPEGLSRLFKTGTSLSDVQKIFPILNSKIGTLKNYISSGDFFLQSFWANIALILSLSVALSLLFIVLINKRQKTYYLG